MYKNGKNITFTDRSNSCVDMFLHDISKSEPLTTAEEYELWLKMHQGSARARSRFIYANLRYVVTIAKKYNASGASFDDLIMSGCEGIVRAADKFDASLGFRFISFATWYIENEVRKTAYDYIRHHLTSLDEPMDADDEQGDCLVHDLAADSSHSADWNLRYNDALHHLIAKADQQQYGLGHLTDDLHHMLCRGYTTADFARKHHLNDQQMSRLLTILREETGTHRQAA